VPASAALQGPPAAPDVPPAAARAWLEAARRGDAQQLAAQLAARPQLLHCWGAGSAFGFTANGALHWAAAAGHLEALRVLLRAGAQPGARNHGGGTALHAAAAHGRDEAVALLLLEGGAEAEAEDALGERAHDAAVRRGLHATAAALRHAAALQRLRDGGLLAAAETGGGGAEAALREALRRAGGDGGARCAAEEARRLLLAVPPLLCAPDARQPLPARAPPAPAKAEAAPPAAEAARARATAAFRGGDFAAAERLYSVALRLTPRPGPAGAGDAPSPLAQLWSNRSAARAARGNFEGALGDAERCIRAAPRWAKAQGRRGAALVGMGQAGEAVKAYAAGLALEPESEALREGLEEAKAAIRAAQARYTEMWGERV